MKLLVLSDSHGQESSLEMVLRREQNCDMIVHLGDGVDDMNLLLRYTVGKPIWLTRGNNDFGLAIADSHVIKIADVTVFACHGHRLQVKLGLERLYLEGLKENAQLCLYGHTHYQTVEEYNGITLLNPGAIMNRRYAVVDIQGKSIVPTLKHI